MQSSFSRLLRHCAAMPKAGPLLWLSYERKRVWSIHRSRTGCSEQLTYCIPCRQRSCHELCRPWLFIWTQLVHGTVEEYWALQDRTSITHQEHLCTASCSLACYENRDCFLLWQHDGHPQYRTHLPGSHIKQELSACNSCRHLLTGAAPQNTYRQQGVSPN